MEDKYLFRGKRVRDGEWVVGSPIQSDGMAYIYPKPDTKRNKVLVSAFADVNIVTLGQCTGLKDRNGTLIFGGDFIKTTTDEDEPEIYRVAFENYSWELRSPDYNHQKLEGFVNDYTVIEIIGNIYDNDYFELLKDG